MNHLDLKKIPLFAELEAGDLKKIEEISNILNVQKGEVVCKEGDPGDAFYIIETGSVDILKTIGTEEKHIVTLNPGEFFGEMALIEGEPRSATCKASADSQLCVITKQNFNFLIKMSPSILLRIMTFLSKRLRSESMDADVATSDSVEAPGVKRKGYVAVSFSAKGGVGKSTFAVNIASALAMHCKDKKVLLWDLDLQFGDIALLLNINPTESISTLVENCSSLQWEGIKDYIFETKGGLHVLPAPARPEAAESITLQHITRIIEILKKEFDYIICDTHSAFNDVTITLLDKADAICLLLTLDLPTIKNSKLCVDVMKSLKYDNSKIKLVVNHITRYTKIELLDVEKKMKLGTACNIPYNDDVVISSVDSGEPFVKSAPSSNVANAIYAMCNKIAENDFDKEMDTGLVSKLKGFFGS